MSFDPNSKIENSEYLFRAFTFLQWKHSDNRVNSGVFNSSSSVSVDRDGGREKLEITSTFQARENYENCGLVRNSAQFYREINCTLTPNPIKPENIYHTLVDKENGTGTNRTIATKLCKNASLVIMAVSN
ncbi:MAG: hypothetical protein IIA48_09500 [Bacteroidetes bacterium]|nr:hypothetical protein [Bacteroidota bacterium]